MSKIINEQKANGYQQITKYFCAIAFLLFTCCVFSQKSSAQDIILIARKPEIGETAKKPAPKTASAMTAKKTAAPAPKKAVARTTKAKRKNAPDISTEANNDSDEIKTISGGVLNGKARDLPQPVYPAAAKAVGASGTVNVQVLIDENGDVVSANAVTGHPLLRDAAVKTALESKFQPLTLKGKPVRLNGIIVYNFSL